VASSPASRSTTGTSHPGKSFATEPRVYCGRSIPPESDFNDEAPVTDRPEKPTVSQIRVLAIHAHPDDIEIQCAGTLLRLKQLGGTVSMATMTPGDCGSAELPCDEIAAVRRIEAQRSADLIGADYTS
jgi:hypothetical protein